MPLSMPMWPPVFGAPMTHVIPQAEASDVPPRRHWIIVDDGVRREVDEAEYRAALEAVLTHRCYGGRP